LQAASDAELDRLLGIVVDVENLFMCVHKEEDPDTKQVYFYLFKLIRKSVSQTTKPVVDAPLVRSLNVGVLFFFDIWGSKVGSLTTLVNSSL